jgi:Uma2 family endonuclease
MTIANISTVKMTADQYFELGEDPPGVRLELVNGEIVVSPSANPQHSKIVLKLSQLLLNFIEPRELGELFADTDTPFEKFMVRRPDLSFYEAKNRKRISTKRLLGPPDLCIEVLSAGNIDDDRTNKFNLYQKHHVGHYWIIDPDEHTAECYQLVRGKYKLIASAHGEETAHFAPFPELAIPLSKLWMPGE